MCKTPSSAKPGCCNIDNTDSESDDDNCQQVVDMNHSWMEEWKLYLNTHEVVPDNMGIVHWWGVSVDFYFLTTACSHCHTLHLF
jgi:hypothetical protein